MKIMIETPPVLGIDKYMEIANEAFDKTIAAFVEKINTSYEYWSDVKYKKLPEGIASNEQLWERVKFSRFLTRRYVWPKYMISLSLTNHMQRMCHEFDMNFGGSWGTDSIIPQDNKEQYLISSLMEEAISSSRMEGASTTRRVAKEMLRKGISPRDRSQQMIHNNYQTIRFIVEHKDTPLDGELLQRIHTLMTERTLENPQDAGRFRTDDNVVVEDGITHEIVHTPPSYTEIPEFVDMLCSFFNDNNSEVFIHPVIRGIIIHFMIAYMHPFTDGNGRTARALFYWYMLKQGYWLIEYMSISRVIAKRKKAYEKAYLYTEADEMDLGYFVAYNLTILKVAFEELKQYINRKVSEKNLAAAFYQKLGHLNERQAAVIRIIAKNPQQMFTAKELQIRFGITHATAKSDLNGLIAKGLMEEIQLNKVKRGYIRSENFDEIIQSAQP